MGKRIKKCFKCGIEKPIDDFYTHSGTSDGHLNKCKECTRRDVMEYRRDKPDRELSTRLKACGKNPTPKNAYRAVQAALKAGVLIRPDRCSACGCTSAEHVIEAHHYDYSRPLDVIWLCVPCHRNVDRFKRKKQGL